MAKRILRQQHVQKRQRQPSAPVSRQLYNTEYYRTGCEGFDSTLDNLSPRLQSIWNAALPHLHGVVLDIGCGRGELTIKAARLNTVQHVHALDYSPAAIKLFLDLLGSEQDRIVDKISVHCTPIETFLSYVHLTYDCVLLADMVEHIPFDKAQALIKTLHPTTNTIIVCTPISQDQPNERHLWLARSETDIQRMAPDFTVINRGYAGSGEDYVFELIKK